jgi:hypothetical protein
MLRKHSAGELLGARSARLLIPLMLGHLSWLSVDLHVAVLGFAKRWFKADSPLPRYLVQAIFPYFIVHQSAITLIVAHDLRVVICRVERSIVTGGTVAICVVTYEIVRRVPLLGPLFGVRWTCPTGSAGPRRPGSGMIGEG